MSDPVIQLSLLLLNQLNMSKTYYPNLRAVTKVSTSKIFRLRPAHTTCFHLGNARIFRLRQAHMMCFNKRNVRSWNKNVSTFKIFRLRRAHMIKEMSDPGGWNKIIYTNKIFLLLIFCVQRKKF